jgi:protein-tyrosine phosphatase
MSLPVGFPAYSASERTSVLFVCLGNICRSPTADGILRKFVQDKGLSKLIVDSCGTAGYHIGECPHRPTISHAAKRKYDLSVLRARQLCKDDYSKFDLILVADASNLKNVRNRCHDAKYLPKIALITDFIPATSRFYGATEVPDPYYGDEDDYERVLDLCEDACRGILDAIIAHDKARLE